MNSGLWKPDGTKGECGNIVSPPPPPCKTLPYSLTGEFPGKDCRELPPCPFFHTIENDPNCAVLEPCPEPSRIYGLTPGMVTRVMRFEAYKQRNKRLKYFQGKNFHLGQLSNSP